MNDLKSLLLDLGPFVIYDTQYAAWEGSLESSWSGKDEHREIIQISAILVDGSPGLEILGGMDILALPSRNSKLSDYVQELTGITQEDLDQKGVLPFEAIACFADFAGDSVCWSYGRGEGVLDENCDINGMPRISSLICFNDIGPVIKSLGIDTSKHSAGTLHEAVGRPIEGHGHNALHDCMSIRECLLTFL